MTRPLNSRHAALLNRLADMQMSPYYATARDTLAEAERVIVQLEAAQELLEGRNSQHVLKAEGASPDATDRETCANVSPDGGPMGAGQAAAAAPSGGREVPRG